MENTETTEKIIENKNKKQKFLNLEGKVLVKMVPQEDILEKQIKNCKINDLFNFVTTYFFERFLDKEEINKFILHLSKDKYQDIYVKNLKNDFEKYYREYKEIKY